MSSTFGDQPGDVVTSSRGDVLNGVSLSLYSTSADAAAGTNLLTSVMTNLLGRWSYTHATLAVVWVRDPSGQVWSVEDPTATAASAVTTAGAAADAKIVAERGTERANQSATYAQGASFVGASQPLMDTLADGLSSTAIQVITDSTASVNTRWVHLLTNWLAARYPAWTVNIRYWADASTYYGAPWVVQTGAGGARYARLDGSYDASTGADGSSGLHVTDSAATRITGDIDVRVEVALDNWASGTQYLAAKYGTAGNYGWQLNQGATFLQFAWTPDGTNIISTARCLTATSAAPGYVAAGGKLWVRVTLDVDNGGTGWTLKYYTSADYVTGAGGGTWTQLGATVSGITGATSIFASTADMVAGFVSSTRTTGNFYNVEVRNGIDGPLVHPSGVDQWEPYSPVVYVGAPVLEVYNGSLPGGGIDAWTPTLYPSRWAAAAFPAGQLLTFLVLSHNDLGEHGTAYIAKWDVLLAAARTQWPQSNFIVTSQNPKDMTVSPVRHNREHAMRRRELAAWARKNGLGYIDIFKAFADAVDGGAVLAGGLLNADGVHPSDATGSPLWATTVENALLAKV